MAALVPFSIPIPILLLFYFIQAHSHPLHVNLYRQTRTRALNSPTTILTIHRNDTPSANLTLHITPQDPFENLVSITHTLLSPSSITFFPTIAPRITLPAILTFSIIGTVNFTITARTTNPFYIYKASFRAIIAGIAVIQRSTQLPASTDSVVALGTYRKWVDTPQLAVPIRLQPPFQSAPVNLHLRLTTLSGSEPATDTPVDAVDSGTCTISLPSDAKTSSNTIFFHGRSRFSTHPVTIPPECALAVSDDFNWLLIRLNPYRVANYGFGLFIEWRGPSRSPEFATLFPMQTFIRFVFDPVIPPVIIRSFTAVMDPFGGELLEIPVENVWSPPHVSALAAEDFQLRLQVTATRQVVTLLTPERVDPVSGGVLGHVLRFRTKPLRANPQAVQYVLLGGKEEKIPAVVHPEDTVTVSLASDELAVLDSCSQNETVHKESFLLVEIGMHYNQSTFTQSKNDHIKRYIRGFFPWLPLDGLRLVDVENGRIRFAVLLVDAVQNNSLTIQTKELDAAIVNGSFALAVNVWENDITSHGIGNVQKTLCEAFPHLLFSDDLSAEFCGTPIRLLLFWVILTMGIPFTIIILITLIVLSKQKNKFNESIATEGYSYDSPVEKASTMEAIALSSLYSYPSEAREVFARRYDVDSTITPENVRDSDLASTVVPEDARGIATLVSFAVQLGRDLGAGLAQNWSRLRGHDGQSESTAPQTPSDSESPPIHIQHVPHSSSEVCAL